MFTEIRKNTVFGGVDTLRKLVDLEQEAILDRFQGVFIGLFRHEGNGQAFGAETAGSAHLIHKF